MTPSAQRIRWRTSSAGFSLIEVVLVLVIISVVAAIALPRYSGWQFRYRALAAARRIAADLELAQTAARARSASRQVVFDSDANIYELPGQPDINRPDVDYMVDLTLTPYHAQIVSADFGGAAAITFDGYGVPNTAGTVVVQAGDVTKTITLLAGTAEIIIE